jgi:hypothetical protein
MAPARRKPGIFCLETSWEKHLADRKSVLPILDLLHRTEDVRYIHRDVGTKEELFHYLDLWLQKGYDPYPVLYLAFHGARSAIYINDKLQVGLTELAETIRGRASGRSIVFGSCDTVRNRAAVADFRKATNVRVVCGYQRRVEWLDSAAFELILLGELTTSQKQGAAVNRIHRNYATHARRLGFVSEPEFKNATTAS